MSSQSGGKTVSPFVVGVSAWLVPGLGYWLIGQRACGVTVFISILMLFVLGVLIGGIRVVDPPGYGQYGYKVQLVQRDFHGPKSPPSQVIRIDPSSTAEEANPGSGTNQFTDHPIGWALTGQLFSEVGNKPWFIGQILCGPISLAMSSVSIHDAHPIFDASGTPIRAANGSLEQGVPPSHSRSWEIGTLYTAVAGMLNLLVIIDSVYRSGLSEDR